MITKYHVVSVWYEPPTKHFVTNWQFKDSMDTAVILRRCYLKIGPDMLLKDNITRFLMEISETAHIMSFINPKRMIC